MATRDQKLWFCGFYEGEGWISNDSSNNNKIRVGMAQNDRTPLDIGQEIWGGSIRKRIRKSPASDKVCVGYEWILYPKEASKFIKDIKPFMLIPYKKKQISDALQQQKIGCTKKFKCIYCDKEYANPAGRRRHQRKEHLAVGKVFACNLCNRTYKSNDSLSRHKRINHDTNNSDTDTSSSTSESEDEQDALLRETP